MLDADLVFIHGFWSSPATWDDLAQALQDYPELAGLRVHRFGYESPKLRFPGSPTRIPDYDDIAQSLPAFLAEHTPGTAPIAIVTHSQGGLILQRFLAWMLNEGRAGELTRVRMIVMLSCPSEGSEYLMSIRAALRFGRHPQASQLTTLKREVTDARRIVLRQIINATTRDDRHRPIPFYVYSGRTDNVVLRESAQGIFPNAEVLPGDHFSILKPDAPGNLTAPTLKRHLLDISTSLAINKTETPRSTARSPNVNNLKPKVTAPILSNLPRRNTRFTGRKEQIEQLRAALSSESVANARGRGVVQALNGIGGVGKSQLAIEYAHMFAHQYDIRWWIDAERPELIGVQLAQLGIRAGWVSHDSGVDDAWPDIADRLRATSRWLLVFDNSESPEHIGPWLPEPSIEGGGHVVITSRHHGWSEIAAQVTIGVFKRAESIALLNKFIPTMSPQNARALAEGLGDLALGLRQAAGHIAETSMPVAEYLTELKSGADILYRRKPADYPLSLGAAVQLNLSRLADLDLPALTLMRLLSLLAPEPVPIAWVTSIPTDYQEPIFGPDLSDATIRPVNLRETVAHAANLGLLTMTETYLQIHRTTRAIIRDGLQSTEFDDFSTRVGLMLACNNPGGLAGTLPASWPAWAEIFPHLLEVDAEHAAPAVREVLREAVWYQAKRGNSFLARSLGEKLFRIWSEWPGKRDSITLACADSLAFAYREVGEYQKAEVLDRESLLSRIELFGVFSRQALHTEIHLSNDLKGLDRLQEALDLSLSNEEARREALHDNPRSRLGADLNTALLLFEVNRRDEAFARICEAKAGLDQELGPNDPDSLDTTGHRALMMRDMGNRDQALPALRETVDAMDRTLGRIHPTTRRYAVELVKLLDEIGSTEEAQNIRRKHSGNADSN